MTEIPRWTDDEMHTAMCLWEAYMQVQDDEEISIDVRQRFDELRAFGTCSLRLLLVDVVKDCDLAWEAAAALGDGCYGSFDWDFVPQFLIGAVMSGRLATAAENQWQILKS